MADRSELAARRYVQRMEHVLRWDRDPGRRAGILAVLQRWQCDALLDEISREEARRLLREFAPRVATNPVT